MDHAADNGDTIPKSCLYNSTRLIMLETMPRGRFQLGPRYWAGISIASVCGAELGDVISHCLHLGHWRGLAPLSVMLFLILRSKRTGRLGAEPAYWLAVIIVRAGATNVADLVNHGWHLDNLATVAGVSTLFLLASLSRPGRPSGPIGQPGLPDTDASYWITLFLAGMLGTLLGDDASCRYGLMLASILLGAILAVLFWLRHHDALGDKSGYWTTLLGARTAGTSIGDLLADRSGLGIAGSAAATGLLLAVLLAWRWSTRKAQGVKQHPNTQCRSTITARAPSPSRA